MIFSRIGVWDQFRSGGLWSLSRLFSPALARKSRVFFARILPFLPENGHLKICMGLQPPSPRLRGGGGTYLSTGRGVPLGVKTWPCLKPLGAHKNTPCHNIFLYNTLITKNFHMHTLYWYGQTLYSAVYHHIYTFIKTCCIPHAPSLVPRSRACHKHCGLGSNPVINGVARQ